MKRKRKKTRKTVIQQHHPVAGDRSEDDELWTIPLKRSNHLFLWRSCQHIKNTEKNLEYMWNVLIAIYFEYLKRKREIENDGNQDTRENLNRLHLLIDSLMEIYLELHRESTIAERKSGQAGSGWGGSADSGEIWQEGDLGKRRGGQEGSQNNHSGKNTRRG